MSCRHTIECENCWNETTVEQYESEYGCEHCELGPNVEQSGIQCDCCERSFSDECGWDNAYSKLIWKYGLEDHPAANEWTMMCPHCQEDDDLVEMYDQEADDMAMDYYREQQENLKKAMLNSLKTAASEYIIRQKNRCAMRTFLIGSRVSNNEMEPISRDSFLHAQQYITALLA
jgi:hypothetical protein